ncbi:MAG: type II toxin-antitoxin system RelE/ParE family toxin [Dethiosulfatibacter sp.]|nr:type II toxin-antitoxin system RelE/ParE family toxin [Dethiosulfatibacter sp.]
MTKLVILFGGIDIKIKYRNSKDKKICTDFKKAKKEIGPIVADKLHSLINFLESASSLMDIKNVPIYRLHPLKGDRKGQFAIDIGRKLGWRLIIIPEDDEGNEWDITDINMVYELTNIILVWEVSKHYE